MSDRKFLSSDVRIKRWFPNFDPKQLTAEDFKITADMFPAATLMDKLLKETSLMHDKIIMDAFKELLGCKTAYDIYILYTTGYGVKQYNSVVDEVNKRLAACGFLFGLGVAKEPLEPSTMIYEQIKANFEEVYANEHQRLGNQTGIDNDSRSGVDTNLGGHT